MGEGSEPTPLPDAQPVRWSGYAEDAQHADLGPMEPTPTPEAGPGGPPDPAPARHPFPDGDTSGDLPDSPIEAQTGLRPEYPPDPPVDR